MSESPILDISSSDIKDLVYTKTNIGGWFFDAYLKMTHTSRLQITDHPVQIGSALTDHAILKPRELTMEVGMSDVATSFVPGQFEDGYSRSVRAFQILKQLQELRVPIQVHTRLGLYENMLIEVLSAPDDYTTLEGLRATVTFREIIVAQVKTVQISARSTVTDTLNRGSPEPTTPNQSILKQVSGYLLGN